MIDQFPCLCVRRQLSPGTDMFLEDLTRNAGAEIYEEVKTIRNPER
jgi:methyl coenzyme M reductase beta subunit